MKSPLIQLSDLISSSLKPFITDITVISMDMPNIKAKEESIVDTEKALSFLKLKI